MIVAAQDQVLAQQLAAGLAGPAGVGMWTTPCSPTGAAPATHFITEGPIDEQFAAMLGDADATFAAAQAAGAPVTLAAIQGLYSRATFAPDVGPFDALAQLGLQLIQVAP